MAVVTSASHICHLTTIHVTHVLDFIIHVAMFEMKTEVKCHILP